MLDMRHEPHPLHPSAEPLGFLIGTWRGRGSGVFHSVDDFLFEEEITFSHIGRPWLLYQQRAWSAADQAPLHTEVGFWRMVDGDGIVNAFIALTAGVDFSEGRLAGTSLELTSRLTAMADGVEQVLHLTREYLVESDTLDYLVTMETDEQPRVRHLEARLHRVVWAPGPKVSTNPLRGRPDV